MKFYIFNRSHSANIGDQLIGKMIEQRLTDAGHSIIHNQSFTAEKGMVAQWWKHIRSYLSDIGNLWSVDRLIIGGGNLVMDTAGLGWAVHQFWLSILCLVLGKKYFYLAVGANPLQHSLSRRLYRFSLNHATKVSVRDSGSAAYLKKLTNRTDIEIIPDPVLSVSELYSLSQTESRTIGLCPIKFEQVVKNATNDSVTLHEKYIELHAELANYFANQGYAVKLFVNDHDVDTETAAAIMARIGEPKQKVKLVSTPTSHAAYLEFINRFSFIISSRMHVAICAISYGIPCLGFGWQPKMKNLFADLNRDGYIDIIELLKNQTKEQSLTQIQQLAQIVQQRNFSAYEDDSNIVAFVTS